MVPYAHELDNEPNPFTDYRITVTFRHESGSPDVQGSRLFRRRRRRRQPVPTPARRGARTFRPTNPESGAIAFRFAKGKNAALDPPWRANALAPFDGQTRKLPMSAPTDKAGRDFRAAKVGCNMSAGIICSSPDQRRVLPQGRTRSPGNLLAYADFDGTRRARMRRRGRVRRSRSSRTASI